MGKLVLVFIVVLASTRSDAQGWLQQPTLSLDANKNVEYLDPNTNLVKKIFPVMLYSFKDTTEADLAPLATSHFWNEASNWGFNMVYSWNESFAAQTSFLANCNNNNKLSMLCPFSSSLNTGIFSFADEPILNSAMDSTAFAN